MKVVSTLFFSLTLLSLNVVGLSGVQAQARPEVEPQPPKPEVKPPKTDVEPPKTDVEPPKTDVEPPKTDVEPQQKGFQFQKFPVIVSGSGCPPGSAEGILNGDTLSVIFSRFEAKASPPKVVSKSCNLRIGLDIPSGLNVQPISVKYLGFADVPQGGSADLDVKILFEGKNVPTIDEPKKTFSPGFSDTWEKDVGIVLGTINACAKPKASLFGINSILSARATKVPEKQETQIRIDTIDAGIGDILYQMKFKFNPC
jgi:Domain of unknown function (DUF4360)